MSFKLLLDFDECLAPVIRKPGTEKLKELLKTADGKNAEIIGDEFEGIHCSVSAVLHGSKDKNHTALVNVINSYEIQTEIKLRNMNFMWSREIWLKYLSDKFNLGLGGRTIMKMIDKFFVEFSKASPMFPTAKEYLKGLKKSDLFVITGSDKRLIFRGEKIIYDPVFSEKKKIERLQMQGARGVIRKENIITGDPFDKPSEVFWKKSMQTAKLSEPSEGIVVDDSLPNVLSAMDFGFVGYLLDKKCLYKKAEVAPKISGYLTDLRELSKHIGK